MNLAATQRDVIRQHNIDAERSAFSPYSPPPTETQGMSDPGTVRRRKAPLWPKLIAFIIGLALLIGALVAGIWFFKKDSGTPDLGFVIKPPPKTPICPDVVFGLGDDLEFECNIKPNGTVLAEFVNKPLVTEDAPTFVCGTVNDEQTPVICTYSEDVSCSTSGQIRVSFYDSYNQIDQEVIRTEILNVTIIRPDPETEMEPVYNDEDEVEEFNLTCTIDSVCKPYEMVFHAGNRIITEYKTCTTSNSPSSGYETRCDATISAEDMLAITANGSRVYCDLQHDKPGLYNEEFVFPMCSDYNFRNSDCTNSSTLFNCDDVSSSIGDCQIMQKCFGSRFVEVDSGCVLKWCRNETTKVIDDSGEIPFMELLCLS